MPNVTMTYEYLQSFWICVLFLVSGRCGCFLPCLQCKPSTWLLNFALVLSSLATEWEISWHPYQELSWGSAGHWFHQFPSSLQMWWSRWCTVGIHWLFAWKHIPFWCCLLVRSRGILCFLPWLSCLLGKWEPLSCDNSAKFMVWIWHQGLAFAHLGT